MNGISKQSSNIPNGITPSRNRKHILCREEYSFSGPLPHPEILAQYEQIYPGLADRITKMAENQATHRQGIEAKVINSNISNERLGISIGTLLTLVALIAGTILIIVAPKNYSGYISLLGTLGFQGYNYYQNTKRAAADTNLKKTENPESK